MRTSRAREAHTAQWLAAEAAKYLPNGRHVMVPHTGHYFGYPCVDKLIAEFMAQGSAKELDTTCVAGLRPPAFVTEEALQALARNQAAPKDTVSAANEEVWEGVLEVRTQKLRLVLRLVKLAEGKLTGKLDSPDQPGVQGLPLEVLTFKEGVLHFELSLIGASYDGKANRDNTEVIGQWQQSGLQLPLTFKITLASK